MLGMSFICHSNASTIDYVDTFTNAVGKGMKVPKEALDGTTKVFGKLDQALKQIEAQILGLETAIQQFEVKNVKVTKEFLDIYFATRDELRLARLELRKLATKTVIYVDELKILVSGDWNEDIFKTTFENLVTFLEECKVVLQDSQKLYNKAIANLTKAGTNMKLFTSSLENSLDTASPEYAKWTEKIRASVYGTASVGTITCIFVDIFVTFGACSAAYNAAVWPATISGVELAVADYAASLKHLKTTGENILSNMDEMEGSVTEATKFLDDELNILIDWEQHNQAASKWASRLTPDNLKALRNVFLNSVQNLKESANEFLERPAEIFESKNLEENLHP